MEVNMGKVKSWVMDMEVDAAEMSLFFFCRKYGADKIDIWNRVNNPNNGPNNGEPEDLS